MMKAIGVIPARWQSTRFPGKVLADICGKPLIQHVWERACSAKRLDDVVIACDEKHVYDTCVGFGANAVMTSADHASGTDRIAEAVGDKETDIIVNVQGDEPLIQPEIIDALVDALSLDENCVMATVVKKIMDPNIFGDPNVVKAVISQDGYALYFSRASIPFDRDGTDERVGYQHFGIYAYTKDFLMKFSQLPQTMLEQSEKLEQLRVLESGYRIRVIETARESVGVDTPEDLKRVSAMIKESCDGKC